MKRILPLLAVAASLILSSCGASKFYSLNETGVHPMALVQPFSYLTDAVGDFTTDFIPAVSQANNELLSETISAVNLPVTYGLAGGGLHTPDVPEIMDTGRADHPSATLGAELSLRQDLASILDGIGVSPSRNQVPHRGSQKDDMRAQCP